MQDATRRPPFAQAPTSHARLSFARIDAIEVWRERRFSARPIEKLVSAFVAALLRFRLAQPCSHRNENAVTILSNALWVEMITRRHWKISAHNGDSYSTLPFPCHPGRQ